MIIFLLIEVYIHHFLQIILHQFLILLKVCHNQSKQFKLYFDLFIYLQNHIILHKGQLMKWVMLEYLLIFVFLFKFNL